MQKEPQVNTFDIDHNRFLLSQLTVLISTKIQISVFLKSLIGLSSIGLKGHIKENIDLSWDFPMIGDNLNFVNFYRPIEFKCNLLRVSAESFCLPASVLTSEQE